MATMIDGESYVGRVLIRPLSQSGDLRLYCWPLRCLKSKMGGPTFGIEVKGEEILRFDAHLPRGGGRDGVPAHLVRGAPARARPGAPGGRGLSSRGRVAGPRAAGLGLIRGAGARGAGRRSPRTRHRPRTAGGLTVPPSSHGPFQLGAACARRAAPV